MEDLVVVALGDADELTVVHHCRHHALVILLQHTLVIYRKVGNTSFLTPKTRDPDPDPIRIQGFDDQKLKRIYSRKKKKFGSKTAIYLSLGLHKGSPSYRCLQLQPPALQNMKFLDFFLLLWINFAFLDSEDSESGPGSTDPIESGSNTDPDPQP